MWEVFCHVLNVHWMCLYGQLNVGSILSCSECALNVFIWTVECGK
jgi:hypothetical protein